MARPLGGWRITGLGLAAVANTALRKAVGITRFTHCKGDIDAHDLRRRPPNSHCRIHPHKRSDTLPPLPAPSRRRVRWLTPTARRWKNTAANATGSAAKKPRPALDYFGASTAPSGEHEDNSPAARAKRLGRMSFALFPRRDASDAIRRDCFVAAFLAMTMGYRVIVSNAKAIPLFGTVVRNCSCR